MKQYKFKFLAWPMMVFLVLIMGLIFVSVTVAAQGPPPDRPTPPGTHPDSPADRPRPPTTDSGGGAWNGGGGGTIGTCSTVHGVVTNWGYRNEPKLPVNLSGASWQAQKFTDDNGYYASECMGFGIGILNLGVPPWLNPLTNDVAVRLGYKESYEVNLGLSGELPPSLPVTPIMVVSHPRVMPGETLTYTILVTNTLGLADAGQTMENVMVTDLFPEGLIPVAMTTTVGTTELWDNLVSVDIGQLLPDQTAVISIAAMVQSEALSSTITNQASLMYKDNLTVQTTPVTVMINEIGDNATSDSPPFLPESGGVEPD